MSSKEFNYERAWKEFVVPKIAKFTETERTIVTLLAVSLKDKHQEHNLNIKIDKPEAELLEQLSTEQLFRIGKLCHDYTDLKPGKEKRDGLDKFEWIGIGWKIENVCNQEIATREDRMEVSGLFPKGDRISWDVYEQFMEWPKGSKEEFIMNFFKRTKVEETYGLIFEAIQSYEFDPHLYMITGKHLKYSDSGMLSEYEIERMERQHGPLCGMKGCNLLFSEHTHKEGPMMRLTRNIEEEKVVEFVKRYAKFLKRNKLVGVCFNEKQFKILQKGKDV